MAVFSLKRFSRIHVLQTIQPISLLALLEPYRTFFAKRQAPLPKQVRGTTEPFDYKRLAEVLVTPDVDTPQELADASFYVHEMSTTDAMEALLEHVPPEELGLSVLELEPADVAVRMWLGHRLILERTHAELFATRPTRFEYYQSNAEPTPFFAAERESIEGA